MDKEKAEKIVKIYNWVRLVILVLFLAFLFIGLARLQPVGDKASAERVEGHVNH